MKKGGICLLFHGAVVAWLTSQSDEQLYLSAALDELQSGIELTRQQDAAQASEIEAWLDQLPESYQVLAMDAQCFREWARLMHEKPKQLIADAMIAATARIHKLIVATPNERDFRQFNVRLVNPFKTS